MSAKSPLGKIKDVADVALVSVVSTVSGTVKDPVGTGQKVVGQALGVAGAVASRVPGLKKSTRSPGAVLGEGTGHRTGGAAARRGDEGPGRPGEAPAKKAAPKPPRRRRRRRLRRPRQPPRHRPRSRRPRSHRVEEGAGQQARPAHGASCAAEPVYTSESGGSTAASPRSPTPASHSSTPRRPRRSGARRTSCVAARSVTRRTETRPRGLRARGRLGPWRGSPPSAGALDDDPFARGVADRAVSTAGPMVVGVVGRVTAHLPRRSRTEPSHPRPSPPRRWPTTHRLNRERRTSRRPRRWAPRPRPWPATCPGHVRPPSRPRRQSHAPCRSQSAGHPSQHLSLNLRHAAAGPGARRARRPLGSRQVDVGGSPLPRGRDRLLRRAAAVVGSGDHDLDASAAAFALLERSSPSACAAA